MPHPPVWAWLNISLHGRSQQDVRFGGICEQSLGVAAGGFPWLHVGSMYQRSGLCALMLPRQNKVPRQNADMVHPDQDSILGPGNPENACSRRKSLYRALRTRWYIGGMDWESMSWDSCCKSVGVIMLQAMLMDCGGPLSNGLMRM
ncbi:hypothetical protein PMIN01_08832 [Paraphaeosphaeria minitans]|uniref:Uncharacterized protein n=1 Tax=Paraphaeosphaeria minitans TaxID=565426 RepID=A0A9P6KP24_9PLEO|nr:hypothetical protein PMIN01_08832 [Paraphaeosphaeria minitans]